MFGGRQLERSANLHPSKILKQKNYTESCGEGGEGVSFLNWGSLPPWGGGGKNITAQLLSSCRSCG